MKCDDVIIPYRLGDKGLGCLYGTKDTSLTVRRLLRDKIHWKQCETIPRDGPTMLRIGTHFIS